MIDYIKEKAEKLTKFNESSIEEKTQIFFELFSSGKKDLAFFLLSKHNHYDHSFTYKTIYHYADIEELPSVNLILRKIRKNDRIFVCNLLLNYSIKNSLPKLITNMLKNKHTEVNNKQNFPLRLAAKKGDIDIVKRLLTFELVDPSDFNNRAISVSKENNQNEVVELLWQQDIVKATLEKDNLNYTLK